MPQKVILITDPGIDGACAAALAMYDPDLEVLALAATAGNVTADEATRKVMFSPKELLQLPVADSPAYQFLRRIIPHGLGASASLYGIEGLYLNDVLAVAVASRPGSVASHPAVVDVETRGELTRGMSVFDARWGITARPNVDVVTTVDVQAVRGYILKTLQRE